MSWRRFSDLPRTELERRAKRNRREILDRVVRDVLVDVRHYRHRPIGITMINVPSGAAALTASATMRPIAPGRYLRRSTGWPMLARQSFRRRRAQ